MSDVFPVTRGNSALDRVSACIGMGDIFPDWTANNGTEGGIWISRCRELALEMIYNISRVNSSEYLKESE